MLSKKVGLVVLFLLTILQMQAQITGQILDGEDGYPIPYASVSYKGHHVSVVCDAEGKFTIEAHKGWVLTFSSIGYKSQTHTVNLAQEEINIKLNAQGVQVSEVVVRSKRKRYSRKNNPAVELMRRVIENKKKANLENHDQYQFMKYQKLTFAQNDLDSSKLDKSWYKQQIELSPYNNKYVLPLTVDETVTQHLYDKSDARNRDIVLGLSSKGLNKVMQTGDILNNVLKEVFQDVDIYQDYIRLVQYPFPSPLGRTAISFYRYYIVDTVKVANDSCYHLRFFPNNQQDFGFTGELYIIKDSTLQLKQAVLNIPKKSTVNFVRGMRIEQEFDQLSDGQWALSRDDMWAELAIVSSHPKWLVSRYTRLGDYDFSPIDKHLWRGKADKVESPDARIRNEKFWDEYRPIPLSFSEQNMDKFVANMTKRKGFGVVITALQLAMENYIQTSKIGEPSKFDIGPVTSMISKNYVDGYRFRLSARTTANLLPHLFWDGYVAYGNRSHNTYYGTTITYALNDKQYSHFEFPRRNIVFDTSRDIASFADRYLTNNKDNIFMTFKTHQTENMYLYNRQKVYFEYETDWGFNALAGFKFESNRPEGLMHFMPVDGSPELFRLRTTDLMVGFSLAPGKTYVNTKQRRVPVNHDVAELELTHDMGLKGFMGGQYASNLTTFKAYKRVWLGSYGYLQLYLRAGAQWNKVPFPLLITPPTSMTLFQENVNSNFNLLRDMEFLNDRYVMWNAAWNLNGKLFNRIPLIKKLKWREYISVKGMIGHLTDKNNPFKNPTDSRLWQFPSGSRIMGNTPYWEMMVGVHNIFKFFGVNYVRRITYRDYSGVDKNGVRFSFMMSF